MFSTPTNRVARTITRSAIATAMVAPILTFGAQAAMAGGDPDPMVGNVKTDVVYDCKGSALNLVPVLTNTGAPRTVRLFVRSNEADKVVFFEDFDLTDQFSVSLPVSTNDTYLVTVTESVAGLGTPSQVSYKQDFIVPKSCSTSHNFTTSAVSSCAGLTPIIAGTVTNTGDSSDAYTVKGIGGNGNDISKILVIPSGATADWNLPISQMVAVSSNAVVAMKQLGPFIPVPCAVAPSDGGSGEGPKGRAGPGPNAGAPGHRSELNPELRHHRHQADPPAARHGASHGRHRAPNGCDDPPDRGSRHGSDDRDTVHVAGRDRHPAAVVRRNSGHGGDPGNRRDRPARPGSRRNRHGSAGPGRQRCPARLHRWSQHHPCRRSGRPDGYRRRSGRRHPSPP